MTSRRRSAQAFALVELLVVLAIVGVLVALLLPALANARVTTHRVVCAGRLRQAGTAELVYLNDHRYLFPRYGSYSASLNGTLYSNPDWQEIYTNYLGLSAGANVATTMRFLPQNSALQCPANIRRDSSRDAYVAYAASANNFNVTQNRLERIFYKYNLDKYGNSPALLGDRIVTTDYIAGGVRRTETNHWYMAAGPADGGNTYALDGSVRWYGYWQNTAATAVNNHVNNGAIFNLIAWPGTAIIFSTDSTGDLDLRSGNPNAQVGYSWTYTSNFPAQ